MVSRTAIRNEGRWAYCTLDLRDVRTDDEAFAAIAEAKAVIAACAPKSVRALTDVTGFHMSLPVIAALRELARQNEPFIDRSAVVGMNIVHRVALNQIVQVTGRDIREFTSRDAAMHWLTE